jgi:RecA/RadA recombinase
MDFFKSISTGLDNEYAGLAADGITAGDITGFLPTGSYMFNAMLSGDLFGGVPSNKITVIAGEEATGKTFFLLGIIKHFLDNNEQGMVVFFESESAISKAMLEERGLDTKRIMVVPVATIQEFRHQILKVVDNYEKMDVADRRPMMLSLDSFGMLSTTKEVEDTMEGSETKDMTRAAIAKALFRVLTLKLGKLDLPLLITNHTYQSMGMFSTKEMSGGTGLKYSASNIVFLGKRKEKDGASGPVIGSIVRCTLKKGRLTRENSQVEVMLTYDKGLHPYFGLTDLALEAGVFKKASTRIELPDGTTQFAKAINKSPEKYFTQDVMDELNKFAATKFLYGDSGEIEEDDEDE